MANELNFFTTSTSDFYVSVDGIAEFTDRFGVGYTSDLTTTVSGALRFPGVTVGQGTTVNEAILHIRVDTRYGSSPVKVSIKGIKETNTSSFGSGVDGRPRTTASNTHEYSGGSSDWFGISVTSIVNEILGQGGWSSGNAMGFYVEDNGTSTSGVNQVEDEYGVGSDSILSIRVNAEPNFTPTPISVSAPTFPQHDKYGIKISMPGVSVHTATDEQLYFTTYKDVFKVNEENVTSCTANVEKVIPHGLGYIPQVLAYCRAGGQSMKLPRFISNLLTDPISGGAIGYVYVDATNVRIIVSQTSDVYYYIFSDEQAT